MIKHIWSVLCKESVIDGESNNVSLLNVIEKVKSQVDIKGVRPEVLQMPFSLELVTLWQRTSSGKFVINCQTELISPEGKTLSHISQDIEFPKDKQRMRNRVRMNTIPITSSGIYIYKTTTSVAEKKGSKLTIETPLEVEVTINTAK